MHSTHAWGSHREPVTGLDISLQPWSFYVIVATRLKPNGDILYIYARCHDANSKRMAVT